MNQRKIDMGLRVWRGLGLGALLLVQSLVVQAQSAIEAVTGFLQGGVEVVRIDFSKPLTTAPTGFVVQSPARVALDFPGVVSAMGRSTVEMNQGNLKSVSVVQAGERTRVVLNLKSPTSYTAEIQGKSLVVALQSAVAAAPAVSVTTNFAENRNRDVVALKDVDFRRAADGAGRVIVGLPNNQVGVDIRQQGQGLLVEFAKSSLPEGLRRRLDVADFGTPVKTVTMTQTGERVRMVIEPTGNWEHSAYQSDDQFVIEVKEVKVDPRKLTAGVGFNGQKLSLNFQNIEVRALLQVIADFTNFNVVTSDSVNGSVTLRLQDVPWDQALDIILQAKSLGYRKSGNVLWIAPKDEIAAKEKLELESTATNQSLEPLKTQFFQINYASAKDLATQLTAGGVVAAGSVSTPNARLLSSRGSVIAIERTNQLFVTDIPSKLEQIQELVGKVDVPVRQVLIEARLVEAADSFGKSLGVKLGASDIRAQRGGDGGYQLGNTGERVAWGTSYANAVATSGASSGVDTGGQFFSLPASALGANAPASFALSVFNTAANRFLNLEISAMEADGKGKVVSSPRVVTTDKVPAVIEQGEELPYSTLICDATGKCNPGVAFKKINLKLEVTPQITPDGGVILKLDINKDVVGRSTPAGFGVNNKHVKTEVLVDNGGTVVIGGIFEEEDADSDYKVPVLGDIPVLGHLFKTKTKTNNKKELLVFITPKLVSERNVIAR
ncbi:MAG: type IV pilus secretin PilQ [Rhodoferax sp.]